MQLQATGFPAGNVLMRDDGQAEQVHDDNDDEPGDMNDWTWVEQIKLYHIFKISKNKH